MFAGTRRAMTLGFPDHLTKAELSEAYRSAYLTNPRIIPHEIVTTGPVFENTLTGDDIDIYKFPCPMWHEHDGGRFVGTGTYSITLDPEEGWLNAGAYRAQVHDKKSVGVQMASGHHGFIHRAKYFKRGEPMPMIMVLGGDPMAFFYGGVEAPYGTFELDIVGGMRGAPVKMVRGPITGLPMPANAEVVLEGFVTPDRREMEGPFGEWTGYYAGGATLQPVLDIKAIYHRDSPIVVGCPPMGGGPDEMSRYRAVLRSAMVKQYMTNAGVPDVQQVWCHEVGGARQFHAVSIKQRYGGHAVQAGHIAAQCGASAYGVKYIIVVDEDIDVSNLDQVLWALTTRTNPAESIQFIHGSWDSPADARLSPQKREVRDFTHSVAVIDACRPFLWRNEFPPPNTPSPEFARKARERFGWLLSGEKPSLLEV
jgi:4-hydroxy-3-polyprenylbenzoate decarboxylase